MSRQLQLLFVLVAAVGVLALMATGASAADETTGGNIGTDSGTDGKKPALVTVGDINPVIDPDVCIAAAAGIKTTADCTTGGDTGGDTDTEPDTDDGTDSDTDSGTDGKKPALVTVGDINPIIDADVCIAAAAGIKTTADCTSSAPKDADPNGDPPGREDNGNGGTNGDDTDNGTDDNGTSDNGTTDTGGAADPDEVAAVMSVRPIVGSVSAVPAGSAKEAVTRAAASGEGLAATGANLAVATVQGLLLLFLGLAWLLLVRRWSSS